MIPKHLKLKPPRPNSGEQYGQDKPKPVGANLVFAFLSLRLFLPRPLVFFFSGSPNLGRGSFPVFLLAAVLLASGCGHPVQETAAHKIADVLPSVLGPAARYDVQVDGDPFALTRGRARAIHIQGQDVQIAPAVTLDTLGIDARDVSFDTETRRLSHIGETAFTASLGQANLTRYLAQSKPLLPGLVITLLPDAVEARVPVDVLNLHTTAVLSGSFRPDASDPSQLDFAAQDAQVGGVSLPASLVNLAVNELNPILDLSNIKVPLTVTDARITNSRLVLSGTARLDGLIRP